MSVVNSSLSLLFSLSFTSLSPTFSFSLSFSIFQICEHENKSKLNTLDNTDIETIFAFLFVFIDSLIVSASQDAGGHAISRQKNLRVAFGLSYLLIESFYIGISVVRTDVRLRDYVTTKISRIHKTTKSSYPWCSAARASGAQELR